MQKAAVIFANGSVLQVCCSPEKAKHEADRWAGVDVADEVWLVPATGLRRIVRAFREHPDFLRQSIRHIAGAIKIK